MPPENEPTPEERAALERAKQKPMEEAEDRRRRMGNGGSPSGKGKGKKKGRKKNS
jgi:hypothetical protein